jgi:hypothetical protein
MTTSNRLWMLLSALTMGAIATTTADAAGRKTPGMSDWATIAHERLGFQIAYPANVFGPRNGPVQSDGQVFVSRDGAAKLVIGAFVNDGGTTMAEYRQQLLTSNYAGANVDFAPVRRTWFIVSGTQGAMHFYERVSFTCDGHLINSWALLYPAAQRAFYDRVVDAIAPTYAPGAGASGSCNGF